MAATAALEQAEARRLPSACGVATAALVVASLLQQLYFVERWVRHYVSEDQALLWAAGRSWSELRPRQPNFWGQAYGVTLEVVPAVVLRVLGFGYQVTLPVSLMMLNLGSFWVLAWAASRRGERGLAVMALALPLLLSTEYAVMTVAHNTAFGRFLASVAVAIVFAFPNRIRAQALFVALGGLAVLFDTGTVLLVVPALVFTAVASRRELRSYPVRQWAVLAAAAVVPATWWAFTTVWYRVHPDHALHPSPVIRPSISVLSDNVSNPTRHFAVIAPELLRSPVIAAAIAIVLVAAAFRSRSLAARFGVLTMMVLVAAVLSSPRSLNGFPTVYYHPSRALLALPLSVWAAAFMVRTSRRAATSTSLVPWTRYSAALLGVLVVLTIGARISTRDDRIGTLRGMALHSPTYPLAPVTDVLARCDEVEEMADELGATVLVFDQRIEAYVCASRLPSRLTTVYPSYERRAWVLHGLASATDIYLLFVGATGCWALGGSCVAVAPGAAVAATSGQVPVDVIRAAGYEVRPFDEPS